MRSFLLSALTLILFISCDDDPQTLCGNNTVDSGEECDGDDFSGKSCTSLDGQNFRGGILLCKNDCTFDTTGCIEAVCGDSVAEGIEACDGNDFAGKSCMDFGFSSGNLHCIDCAFDTSECSDLSNCGNNLIDEDEVCDGNNHNEKTCEDFGYSSGFLICSPDCSEFFLGSCHNNGGTCGDGILDDLEQCDGSEVWHSCAEAGFTGGDDPQCNDNCTYDYSTCEGDICEMAGFYNDGFCMGCEFMNGHEDPDCASVCQVEDGVCRSIFVKEYGTSSCIYHTGTEDPDCGTCGDGVWNQFGATGTLLEQCDGDDLGDVTCEDYSYSGGILRCSPNCRYDFSECI